MERYDLIVIGGGPAGYLSAERAGALGKSVLVVEREEIGGVCLTRGCIPTKTLLHGAKLHRELSHADIFGLTVSGVTYDLARAMEHKRRTVTTLQKGIMGQFKRLGVTFVTGTARLLAPGRVTVDGNEFGAEKILLATGARPARPPIPGIQDNPGVLTSREILELDRMPASLTIIGGGYIGMEFATYFASFGVPVTVVEMTDEIIPTVERDIVKALRRELPEMEILTGHRVTGVQRGNSGKLHGGGQQVLVEGPDGPRTLESELVLLSTGRVPNVEGSGFEEAGIDFDRRGVRVDEYMQTNLPGVYAAGDVTGKVLLAHAAYRMGEVAVAHMFRDTAQSDTQPGDAGGRRRWPNRMRYDAIPWVVFTSPEIAGCGLGEEEARARGIETRSATVSLKVSGRYLAEHPRERGTVTVITDASDGRLIGVRLYGSGVGEIIHSAAIMIEQELRVQDVREIVFPHPTVSEALRDAVWDIYP